MGQRSGPQLAGKVSPGGGGSSDEKSSVPLPIPADAPSTLRLSGNIISATCFTPHKIGYKNSRLEKNSGPGLWEISPRRGSSALYDTLKNLAEKGSGWSHTVVGWTGEITELKEDMVPHQQLLQDSGTVQNGLASPAPSVLTPEVPAIASRGESCITSSPAQVAAGITNRMTMKGGYSRSLEEKRPRMRAEEKAQLREALNEKGREAGWDRVEPVWLGGEGDGGHPLGDASRWRQYAERVLWPTFHYIVPQAFSSAEGSALEERVWWRDYLHFNNAFADKIAQIYRPGDIIWVHDYHLLVLPEILRQRIGQEAHIGLFVHAPWPSSEIFKILSRRRPLLEGMLAANMVAFQSLTYKEHFVSCCKRILDFTENRDTAGNTIGINTHGVRCAIHVNPIGMDVDKVIAAVTQPRVEENMAKIKSGYGGKKIVVGGDRLDGVRGVLQKLRAFERFLESNLQWVGRVVLIQITSPSHLIESADIEVQVSELVSKINGKFGSLHYTPVQHYPQYLQPEEYFALLRVSDLGLITSVRDGMNTASLEYIICQRGSYGPIILSEFTGTAESLSGAIIVNPTNTAQVAEQIRQCLEFTEEERKAHHQELVDYVARNTAQTWNTRFLLALFEELECNKPRPVTSAVDTQHLLNLYNGTHKRLFMFDYDGTLTPIVQDPQMATPTDRVVRTLKQLAQQPGNTVWIISGRSREFLGQWLGHIEELGLSAEHGCFIRPPKSTEWQNLAAATDMGWQRVAERIFQKYTEKTAGSFVERKDIAITWHYRRAEPVLGRHMAGQCHGEAVRDLSGWDVEVMEGKANIEVRPKALNKGGIARRLMLEANNLPYGFVFCAGDDRTDEDMFRALSALEKDGTRSGEILSVTVGPSSKITEAKWHLPEPSDVVNAIGLCIGAVDHRDVP